MHSHRFVKYAFKIRTRLGVVVPFYRDCFFFEHGCQIVECVCHHGSVRIPVVSFEEVANIIVR